MNIHRHYICDQSGAITVEKMVVIGGIVGLGIAVMSAISKNTEVLAIRAENVLGSENVTSGNFNDVLPGMVQQPWGWYTNSDYAGWTSIGHPRVEIVNQGHLGFEGTISSGMAVDIEGAYRGKGIQQTFDNLVPGQNYKLSFDAADPKGNNTMQVVFGGEIIGTVDPSSKGFDAQSFNVLAGSGDGTDTLQFISTGPIDGSGVYVDNVSLR